MVQHLQIDKDKNMIGKILKLSWFALLMSITLLEATDIKGKINANNSKSKKVYALEGIKVDLYQHLGQKWQFLANFKTDSEGMYYFKDLKAGSYSIQVDGKQNYPIEVLKQEQQEIAPIVIHFD